MKITRRHGLSVLIFAAIVGCSAVSALIMTTWIELAKGSEFRREHAFVEPNKNERGKLAKSTWGPS